MKILKLSDTVIVVLEDGSVLTETNCSDEKYNSIVAAQNDLETLMEIFVPQREEVKKEVEEIEKVRVTIENSEYLSLKGDSIIMPKVCELTLPQSFVEAVLLAEEEEDEMLLNTYKNFWTLCSLNPDSRARTNLFWFLQKYGMTISESGLFVAYRNVNVKSQGTNINVEDSAFITAKYHHVKTIWKKSPKNFYLGRDEDNEYFLTHAETELSLQEAYENLGEAEISTTYTDARTGKMEINIGQPVVLAREECDAVQENTCSSGLHVAGKDWISRNYFGDTQLMVLVNPTDVVAVPPQDGYGKMRVCSYYPIMVFSQANEEAVIEEELMSGFQDDFFSQLLYDGDVNEEESFDFSLRVPLIPELSIRKVEYNLANIRANISDNREEMEEEDDFFNTPYDEREED